MQYFIHEKALFYKDHRAAAIIQQTKNRCELEVLDRRLGRYAIGEWPIYQLGVMRAALTAKHSQNPKLRNHLLKTGDAVLAKTGMADVTWGIGWNTISNLAKDVLLWDGYNLLGYLLMDIRDFLKRGWVIIARH